MQKMVVGAGIGMVAFAILGGILAAKIQSLDMPVGILGGAAMGAFLGMLVGTR